jgi:DNA invertase Pin-like site-specific DNA recombinase
MSKLMFQVTGAFAEFERSLIKQGIHAAFCLSAARNPINDLGRKGRIVCSKSTTNLSRGLFKSILTFRLI